MMVHQNPVFIPGPTNMPEEVRKACYMPTIDHRSPIFGGILNPCLENVFSRHHRIAEGVRAAVGAWGLKLCALSPDVYSDTVSAIRTPEGFDANHIVSHAANVYGVALGTGLGEVAGKVFRIGHLGSLTDVMMLSGLATVEMCLADLGLDVTLGSGVAAAQDYYRTNPAVSVR